MMYAKLNTYKKETDVRNIFFAVLSIIFFPFSENEIHNSSALSIPITHSFLNSN
jgi:hypothetical protein